MSGNTTTYTPPKFDIAPENVTTMWVDYCSWSQSPAYSPRPFSQPKAGCMYVPCLFGYSHLFVHMRARNICHIHAFVYADKPMMLARVSVRYASTKRIIPISNFQKA